mmetsp:Transcript_581/g.1228  ORF Transcript_581/g.1228 Transcript_581/m.1228 type:complete len:206 (-) Transcript_581:345-962(-)
MEPRGGGAIHGADVPRSHESAWHFSVRLQPDRAKGLHPQGIRDPQHPAAHHRLHMCRRALPGGPHRQRVQDAWMGVDAGTQHRALHMHLHLVNCAALCAILLQERLSNQLLLAGSMDSLYGTDSRHGVCCVDVRSDGEPYGRHRRCNASQYDYSGEWRASSGWGCSYVCHWHGCSKGRLEQRCAGCVPHRRHLCGPDCLHVSVKD